MIDTIGEQESNYGLEKAIPLALDSFESAKDKIKLFLPEYVAILESASHADGYEDFTKVRDRLHISFKQSGLKKDFARIQKALNSFPELIEESVLDEMLEFFFEISKEIGDSIDLENLSTWKLKSLSIVEPLKKSAYKAKTITSLRNNANEVEYVIDRGLFIWLGECKMRSPFEGEEFFLDKFMESFSEIYYLTKRNPDMLRYIGVNKVLNFTEYLLDIINLESDDHYNRFFGRQGNKNIVTELYRIAQSVQKRIENDKKMLVEN